MTSARPRPSFFQRECTAKRSPLVVLCMAKSTSPPPEVSFLYEYTTLFFWPGWSLSFAPRKVTPSCAGPTLEYEVTCIKPVALPAMPSVAILSKSIWKLPEPWCRCGPGLATPVANVT